MEDHDFYAVVLIKPDAVRDVLQEMIFRDLEQSTGITSVFRKYWRVNEATARLIYSEWTEKVEFPSMVRNLTQGPSILIVVKGQKDVYESLKRIKGKMNKGGLRIKYRRHSIEELVALGYSDRALQDKIAENRLHTTDDLEDTVFLCALAMSPQDLRDLEQSAPMLSDRIRRRTALQKRTMF